MAELGLYLAIVGLLREHGIVDASKQVYCELQTGRPAGLVVRASRYARPLLASQFRSELGREFDVGQPNWRLSPREAHRVIERWAVM
jgi:hypothetical protein